MTLELRMNSVSLPEGVTLRSQSITVDQEIYSRAVLSFVLTDKTGTFHPLPGWMVELREGEFTVGYGIQPYGISFYGGADAEYIFAGSVDEPKERKLNPDGVMQQSIICVDNHYITDRRVVAQVFSRQVAGDIVRWIINNVLAEDGITVGEIQDGPLVGPVNSPHLPASQLLGELAELVGFAWRVNPDKTLDFYDKSTFVADALDENSPILWGSLEVWRDRTEYRNRQILKNVSGVTGLQDETPAPRPDGSTQIFILRFEVAEKPRIFVNGAEVDPAQVGILGIDKHRQWYWNKGQNTVSQGDEEPPLETGDELRVVYRGQFKTVVQIDDEDAIDERKAAEGGSGLYELVKDAPECNDIHAATEKAEAMLRRFARIAQKATMASEEINFQVGEIRQVTIPVHDVNGEFLVMNVGMSDRGRNDGKLLRTAVLVDGEALGGWVEFFRKWLETTRDLTIRTDEIVRLLFKLPLEMDLRDLSDGLEATEAAPPFRFRDLETDGSFEGNIVWGRWQWLG